MAESHMKMAESHMKMAESHMKFKTRSFTFECSGDAVKDGLKIAEKAVGLSNSFTVSADLGFVGVSATLVWQTKNPEKYAEAVNRGILGNVENAFVQSFTPGSLTVEVVALKKTAADAIMEMHESGEIKKNLNKAIKEYADQHHHGLGQFDHVLLTNNNEHTVTKQEIDKVQRDAISSFKTLKREQKLDLPIWRNPTEIKTTKDETAIIGRGGFGVVLLGYCEQIGRCAVKCIGTPNIHTACKVEKSFIREAGIILLAHHANIVQVYGITSWVGSFGIIMEYMERGNLSQLIQSVRLEDYIIPFDLLVRILLQVANGVAFLHRIGEDQQIVHGDLKPSNVVLKDDFTAKVTDFGGATLRTYTNTGDAYREADDGQNTMPYTAPERLQQPQYAATKASDVYSYGMIIYECLTLYIPFHHGLNNINNLVRTIINNKIKPPCDKIDEMKKIFVGDQRDSLVCLDKWMNSCWEYNKEDRPPIKQVRDDLQQHFDKVARNVWKSIAEVSSKLEVSASNRALSKPTIPISFLNPPSFKTSDVSTESHGKHHIIRQEEGIKIKKIKTTADINKGLEDILPLIKQTQETMTDSDTSSHEALVETVNEALDKLGELRSDDCTRLVCELHILCQRVREVTPAQVRELAKHGLKRCLRIQDGNVQESYHSSLLALM